MTKSSKKTLYVDWYQFVMADFDLFYLFSSHWYLAVICFAGQEEPVFVNEINDDDESDTKVRFAVDNLKILKLYAS